MKIPGKFTTFNGYTLFLFLIFLSQFFFLFSLTYVSKDMFYDNPWENIYLILSTALNPFFIFLAFFPVLYLLSKVLPSKLFTIILSLGVGSAFTLLIVDKIVYSLFKFHLNGFVLKVLQQSDARAVLGVGAKEIILINLMVLGFCLISFFLLAWLQRSSVNSFLAKILRGKTRKLAFILAFLFLFTSEKTVYSWLLFNKHPSVVQLANTIPFYLPARMGRTFEKMGIEPPAEANLPSLNLAKKQIQYPLQAFVPTAKSKRPPNIFWLVTDSLRYDMISSEVMPYTNSFAAQTLRFKNHFSGSNGTANALFSMFYGIPAVYRDYFTSTEISPIFIDALLANAYQIDLLASRDLGWFSTDRIIFFKIKDRIQQNFHGNSEKSDEIVTQKAVEILRDHKNNKNKPLFLMTFFDSPHLPHFKHPKYKKFQPEDTGMIFNPDNLEDRIRGINEYKNAANFIDDQLKQILEKIREWGYLENSIIIITADHGSENFEHGHWGHASAFTNEQLKVPLLLYYPGVKPEKISPYTSHVDLAVTMLALMGEKFDRKNHSTGQSLINLKPRDFIVASGDRNRVLIDPQYKIDYNPLAIIPYYNITDGNDNPTRRDKNKIMATYTTELLAMFEQFKQFLK